MISFDHVGLRYGVGPEILTDVTFRLEPGSFHFLYGPSGAGKTSLMRLLYLGHKPTRGVITLFGQNVAPLDRDRLAGLRQQIGVVFQDFRLLDHLSVFDNVALPLRIAGRREDEIRKNVTDLLEWVGLGDRLQARPRTLSGGQQQRVAIARAVITRPQLLLADEPTGNLDETMGFRLMTLFEQLNRMGTTIVISTHARALLDRFPHRRLKIEDGQVQRDEGPSA